MLKILILYGPTIPLLDIYLPRITCKCASGYSTYLFIGILQKVRWEQATCPSTVGGTDRLPYSETEYVTAMKMNKLQLKATGNESHKHNTE